MSGRSFWYIGAVIGLHLDHVLTVSA